MKPKRKLKNGYRLSNKRFLVIVIGLLVILTLAVANMAYMVNYRIRAAEQTAMAETMIAGDWYMVTVVEAMTATQSLKATQTAAAHEP